MEILLVDGFEGDDAVVATARAVLEANGHTVHVIDLAADDFRIHMTMEERRLYHDEGENLLDPQAQAAADLLPDVQGVLFCCPHVTFGVPARVKGFLDRVFIPGVAFTFDDADKLDPKLRHIRRVGLITRSPHDARTVRRARDGARRYILWTVRLNCSWFARRTHVRLRPEESTERVSAALRRW
ncbi:MAG: NAD(P)H-dependent oxidoreductase [Actinomycetota bacterium]